MKKLLLLGLLIGVVVVGVGLSGMYWAVTTTQPYYLEALQEDPVALEEKSRQLESRFTALQSDLQSEGEWQTVVAADEINGWLALKLPELFPKAIPADIRDPRIAITSEAVLLAAATDVSGVGTVVSVAFEPFVTEEGDLAIEIQAVFAGALPLPSKEIIDKLSQVTQNAGLPIRWTQNNGRKVMVIERQLWDTGEGERRVLEAIELSEGRLFLSGRTEKVDPELAKATSEKEPRR